MSRQARHDKEKRYIDKLDMTKRRDISTSSTDNKGGRNGRPIYSKLFNRNVLKNSLKELPAFCY